jgi:predicted ATPase
VKTGQQQFVIATHSPLLMSYPNATLLVLENGEFFERNVRTTSHFQILARFFADPEAYIRKFLE